MGTPLLHITWDDAETFVKKAAAAFPEVIGVYGPARGGLPLAVMFSHLAGVPLLEAPCPGCLVIDDICDTGRTLYAQSQKADRRVATLAYKRQASFEPDLWLVEAPDNEWVVFPWELGDLD